MAVCVPVVISVASKQHRLHVHLLLKQDSGVVLTYRPAHSCTLKMVQQAKDRRVEFHVQSPEHRLYKTPSREACTLTDVIFAMCEILMALYPLESNNGLPGTPATALLQLQRECLQKFYVPVSSWAPLPACASQQLQRMIGLLKGWNCTLSDHFKNSSRFCKAAPSSAHVTRYGNKYKIPEWVVLCKHSELANIVQCCKEPQRFI